MPRQRVVEPAVYVVKEHDQQYFPGEETVETMRARLEQGFA